MNATTEATCTACEGTGDGYRGDACQACHGEGVLRCLDRGGDDCKGTVELRYPLSGTGRSFPRCDGHWAERLNVQEGINRRYPDSPVAPSDFDPSYAGESWDEDY